MGCAPNQGRLYLLANTKHLKCDVQKVKPIICETFCDIMYDYGIYFVKQTLYSCDVFTISVILEKKSLFK